MQGHSAPCFHKSFISSIICFAPFAYLQKEIAFK